jgi:hypothetical protein
LAAQLPPVVEVQ